MLLTKKEMLSQKYKYLGQTLSVNISPSCVLQSAQDILAACLHIELYCRKSEAPLLPGKALTWAPWACCGILEVKDKNSFWTKP